MPVTLINIFNTIWHVICKFGTVVMSWLGNNWTNILNTCTVVTFFFGFIQWHNQNKLNHASYAKTIMDYIRNDEEIIDVLHTIEYSDNDAEDKRWYKKSFHENKEIEAKFDRVFAYFNYLCYLSHKKIINDDEFKMIEYKLNRLGYDKNTLNYLFNLYHFARVNSTTMSFSYLVKYLDDAGFIKKDFYKIDSPNYERILLIDENNSIDKK